MDRAEFWTLIEDTSLDGADEATRDARLVALLKTASQPDIADFAQHLDELRTEADSWHMWGAATIILNGWCSDDSFFYFQMWLLTLGARTFSQVKNDPDALATVPHVQYLAAKGYEQWDDADWPQWEGLDYVADDALEEQGGADAPEVDDLLTARGYAARSSPEPKDEEIDLGDQAALSRRYPRLWQLFRSTVS